MKIYNTKSRNIEEFKPINAGQVLLYTCGPTVYDYLQIGNWVSYIRWDILVRVLLADGFKVIRVMNITDVGHLVSDADEGEDKMEKGARREGKTAWDIARLYTDDFLAGMKKLGLIKPTALTKATDYISEQIDLVKRLEKKGYTYVINDGVYFDTSKFDRYADFAKLNLAEIKKGARVEFNNQKRNPSDFALWKFSPKNQKRDMEWDSPWGKGYPGWHLECSAMAITKLGDTIDIHTGGIDHIPIHHTNEIAQSECATGKVFANYWVHSNFLMVDGAKISKSLGNGYTLQDIEAKGYSGQDFKLFVLQSNYRSESNFTWENLQSAHNRLINWRKYASLRFQVIQPNNFIDIEKMPNLLEEFELLEKNHPVTIKAKHIIQRFSEALNNDLNTPKALSIVEEMHSLIDRFGMISFILPSYIMLLQNIKNMLGIDLFTEDLTQGQRELVLNRNNAREKKNWQEADKIRTQLEKQGVILEDSKFGQIWYKV